MDEHLSPNLTICEWLSKKVFNPGTGVGGEIQIGQLGGEDVWDYGVKN